MLETIFRTEDSTERCGLILNDGTIVEIPNIAREPGDSFEMDSTVVLPFLIKGEVAGTWHTHVGQAPDLSGEDYAGFMGWPELKHHIIGIDDGIVTVKSYEIKNGAIVECD